MCQKFDHILTLKMTGEMRDDIDQALVLVQDSLIRTRSEFLRMACRYATVRLASGSGDVPVDVGERKNRVLSGTEDLDTDSSDQVPALIGNDIPRPLCA